jgi:hypothetical protein
MEYFDDSRPRGFASYLELIEKLTSLETVARQSLERGEMLPGREYRRGLREFKDMLKHAREESLRRSSRDPDPI